MNSQQRESSYGNPFAVAPDVIEQRSNLLGPENSQSTSLKAYESASPEKQPGKLSKKAAGVSKQAQASQNAERWKQSSGAMADNHSPSKVLYKYARKSVGASTTATGGGAANTSTKLGGAALYSTAAGPVLGQGASWAQTGRPSAGAAENYATGRNSIMFKLSERKYKDSSRFCDLLSSSSNDSSKDDDRRVEDEASNASNNFNEMMIMVADEDMRVRNNYTSSFLDYDLLLGGGQRRKHDSVIDKQ